jgi:threonine aldolase
MAITPSLNASSRPFDIIVRSWPLPAYNRRVAIDLRSDTVTRPTAAMREAMAGAPVGDDQFGEDPTINQLQARVAGLLGKEAALWLPSGTMANQVALRILTRPGDDVIVGRGAHTIWSESGAAAANAGIQFTEIGRGGTFTAEEFLAARKPRGHVTAPPTTMVQIENTHNRGGGVVFNQGEVERICDAARALDIASYLDGARLWNAAVASEVPPATLAAPFDLVGVALSKGLGAPAGSMLAGSAATIGRAVRARRMLGGAMRQVGILAAAGLYALDHHMTRLVDDHRNAQRIALTLAGSPRIHIDPETVQTNIVIFGVADDGPEPEAVVTTAREQGVLVFAFGGRAIRAVTHYDVTDDECVRAAAILRSIVEAG